MSIGTLKSSLVEQSSYFATCKLNNFSSLTLYISLTCKEKEVSHKEKFEKKEDIKGFREVKKSGGHGEV